MDKPPVARVAPIATPGPNLGAPIPILGSFLCRGNRAMDYALPPYAAAAPAPSPPKGLGASRDMVAWLTAKLRAMSAWASPYASRSKASAR
jgi:hypothetical protein